MRIIKSEVMKTSSADKISFPFQHSTTHWKNPFRKHISHMLLLCRHEPIWTVCFSNTSPLHSNGDKRPRYEHIP